MKIVKTIKLDEKEHCKDFRLLNLINNGEMRIKDQRF